jgi:hypothetical protein
VAEATRLLGALDDADAPDSPWGGAPEVADGVPETADVAPETAAMETDEKAAAAVDEGSICRRRMARLGRGRRTRVVLMGRGL